MKNPIRIALKPISTNAMYSGRRFKSAAAKKFEEDVALLLALYAQNVKLPDGDLVVHYRFGTTRRQDTDNNIKCLQDAICRHFGIDDRRFAAHTAVRIPVKQGGEFITFFIEAFDKKKFELTAKI